MQRRRLRPRFGLQLGDEELAHPLALVGMHEVAEVGPPGAVGVAAVAEDALQARGVPHRAAGDVPVDDAGLRGAHHETQPLLLGLERLRHRAPLATLEPAARVERIG